jgi:hypothetical protein
MDSHRSTILSGDGPALSAGIHDEKLHDSSKEKCESSHWSTKTLFVGPWDVQALVYVLSCRGADQAYNG